MEHYSADQLWDQFRHNLEKLWKAFKPACGGEALGAFDQVIVELDKMEELRYPGEKGYAFSFGLVKESGTRVSGRAMKGLRQYPLSLEDIDELVCAVLTGRVTPGWVAGLIPGREGRAQYEKENRHRFF